jgi:hypothetical protein
LLRFGRGGNGRRGYRAGPRGRVEAAFLHHAEFCHAMVPHFFVIESLFGAFAFALERRERRIHARYRARAFFGRGDSRVQSPSARSASNSSGQCNYAEFLYTQDRSVRRVNAFQSFYRGEKNQRWPKLTNQKPVDWEYNLI